MEIITPFTIYEGIQNYIKLFLIFLYLFNHFKLGIKLLEINYFFKLLIYFKRYYHILIFKIFMQITIYAVIDIFKTWINK